MAEPGKIGNRTDERPAAGKIRKKKNKKFFKKTIDKQPQPMYNKNVR
jgi:hypothetical protein